MDKKGGFNLNHPLMDAASKMPLLIFLPEKCTNIPEDTEKGNAMLQMIKGVWLFILLTEKPKGQFLFVLTLSNMISEKLAKYLYSQYLHFDIISILTGKTLHTIAMKPILE